MKNPLDGYQPKSWSTYKISPEEGAAIPAKPVEGIIEASVESKLTEALAQISDYDPSVMFFYDFEQMVAGHTPNGFASLLVLSEEHLGHSVGKWAFVTYEGMDEDPRYYTLYIEN